MEQLIPALSLVIFIVTIVVGIKTKLNLGILSLAVAFIFGLFVVVEGGSISWDLGGEPITSLFPFDIFWPVLTVSLMLNIANNNGTFNIIINKMAGLARGRRALYAGNGHQSGQVLQNGLAVFRHESVRPGAEILLVHVKNSFAIMAWI